MTYQIDNMSLNCIRDVFKGSVNDIYVCKDLNAPVETFYTVMIIKKHTVSRNLLESFGEFKYKPLGLSAFGDGFIVVFPYKQERNLEDFYMGTSYTLEDCEKVAVNLVMECISSGIPFPLLYLILKQGRVNMQKDFSIFFGFDIDLEEYVSDKNEKDCVGVCAKIVLELLEAKRSDRAMSYELLSKKVPRGSYQYFIELYKDVRLAIDAEAKSGFFKRMKAFFKRHSDFFFRIFVVVCILLIIVALLMLGCQLIFGDIGFLRLFFNPFKMIGTESMLQ